MIRCFPLLLLLLSPALASLEDDKVSAPPGMHEQTIYSGFLSTSVPDRKMHYVFIEANTEEPIKAPLAIWLNGGPGCSSLMGMLREVGPFIVGNDYKLGDMLTKNEYGWTNAANMLFLESPSIVGFSSETDPHYHWTDEQTAKDLFQAVKDFLFSKSTIYSKHPLFVTGESYAGKYIPDLSVLILMNNMDEKKPYVNLKGIMVGNGVMNFEDHSLDKSAIQYMTDHDLVSNRLKYIYDHACTADFNSPRCRFVKYEVRLLEDYLNRYNVYETCMVSTSEANRLKEFLRSKHSLRSKTHIFKPKQHPVGQIPDCPSDDGGVKYWNLNKFAYNVGNVTKNWTVCSHLNYSISQRGSLMEYRQILMTGGVRVWLYNGDFDDVVPFPDTQKNLEKLWVTKSGEWSPWNVKDQHGGFFQAYVQDLTVITVKGAGHMVPEDQPKASYQMFYNFVNGKGINNQIY